MLLRSRRKPPLRFCRIIGWSRPLPAFGPGRAQSLCWGRKRPIRRTRLPMRLRSRCKPPLRFCRIIGWSRLPAFGPRRARSLCWGLKLHSNARDCKRGSGALQNRRYASAGWPGGEGRWRPGNGRAVAGAWIGRLRHRMCGSPSPATRFVLCKPSYRPRRQIWRCRCGSRAWRSAKAAATDRVALLPARRTLPRDPMEFPRRRGRDAFHAALAGTSGGGTLASGRIGARAERLGSAQRFLRAATHQAGSAGAFEHSHHSAAAAHRTGAASSRLEPL